VELDGVGELRLGEVAFVAEGGEAFGEVHRECEQHRDLRFRCLTLDSL
jgi:hypothetical protein